MGAPCKLLPLTILLGGLTLAGSAAAQPAGPELGNPFGRGPGGPGRPGPGPGAPQGANPEQLRREVFERMKAMRAWKLTEELKLDEATSSKLFPLLARYDDKELALQKDMGEAMHALRTEAEALKPDGGRLTACIDKLLAIRARQRTLEEDKFKDVRKVLSPLQQARLVMLLPRIEQHFQQRIREAIEARRGRGPGGGGGF
jgi:hypothetical protein